MGDTIEMATSNYQDFTLQYRSTLQYKIKLNLYNTYSASQDYYYSKILNSILNSKQSKVHILFRDAQIFSEDKQCLNTYQFSLIVHNKFKQFQPLKANQSYPKFFGKQINKYYQKWTLKKKQLQLKNNLVVKLSQPFKKHNTSIISGISLTRGQKFEKILDSISYYNPQSNKYYLYKKAMREFQKTRQDIDPQNSLMDINKLLKKVLIQNSYIQNISTISQNKTQYEQQSYLKKNIISGPKMEFRKIKINSESGTTLSHYKNKEITNQEEEIKFIIRTKKLNQLSKVNRKKSDNIEKQKDKLTKYGSVPNLSKDKYRSQKITAKNYREYPTDQQQIQQKKIFFEKKYLKNLQIIKVYQNDKVTKMIQKNPNDHIVKKTIINSKKLNQISNPEHNRITQILNKKLQKK